MEQLIKATRADLPRLAQCHRAAFPRTLSSAMGQHYVEKMLEWYLDDERAFIFLLELDNQCIGYCGGLKFDGTVRVGSASSMIQHSYNQAIKIFLKKPWLFFHPEFISKYKLAIKNVWFRVKRSFGIVKTSLMKSQERLQPHTGLIVIGLDPSVQGKGYGSLLLQEFERISGTLGFNKMMLTVRTDNLKAIRSYLRNGWVVTRQEKRSTTMEKKID